MSKKKKKKKEKVRYIDDGRTIADMSAVGGRRSYEYNKGRKRSSFKEQRKTYFEAMKMMFVPMLVTIGIISAAFLITWLILIN